MGVDDGKLRASVVVLTRNRPRELALCLEALASSRERPLEVLVVDDSDDDVNGELRRRWSDVRWLEAGASRHRINGLRTLGGRASRGEVVAYLDDDSIVEADWLEALLAAYGAGVCGVGGRVIEDKVREVEGVGIGRIGELMSPVGNFHVDSEGRCEVEHLRGCNFSFRRRCLEAVGWFHDGYYGWCFRDDTDICLSLREGGHRLLYEARAKVRHLAAPQWSQSRNTYNLRLAYSGSRWHSYFAMRHGGGYGAERRRYLLLEPLLEPLRIGRQTVKRLLMWVASVAGRVVGVVHGVWASKRSVGDERGGASGSEVSCGQRAEKESDFVRRH